MKRQFLVNKWHEQIMLDLKLPSKDYCMSQFKSLLDSNFDNHDKLLLNLKGYAGLLLSSKGHTGFLLDQKVDNTQYADISSNREAIKRLVLSFFCQKVVKNYNKIIYYTVRRRKYGKNCRLENILISAKPDFGFLWAENWTFYGYSESLHPSFGQFI